MRALGGLCALLVTAILTAVIVTAVMQANTANQAVASGGSPQLTVRKQAVPAVSDTGAANGSSGVASAAVRVEDLGVCQYRQTCGMPSPAGSGQIIMAHGDIDNSGTCHYRVFSTGQQVTGLGNGTYRLLRITGTPQEIAAAVQRAAAGAAQDTGSCPALG